MIPELLYLALEFQREPRRFDHLRDPRSPLPTGITELLAAPGNCLAPDQLAATAATLNASEDDCLNCLPFFVKQVLLEPQGNYYRVLGVSRDAELAVIKEHYRYLIRLFHPDKDVGGEAWDDLYAPRINEAYNSLRNPAKRAEYNATLPAADGFNPGELARVAQPAGPAVPAVTAVAPPAFEPPALLRKPWFYGAVFVAVVALFLGLLLSSNNSSQLTVTAQPRTEAAATRTEQTTPAAEVEVALQRDAPGYADTTNTVAARNGPTASDRRIEELIKARVAQATTAVLGAPRPRAKPKARPKPKSMGSDSKEKVKPEPQPELIVATVESVVAAEVAPVPVPVPLEPLPAEPVVEVTPEPEIAPDPVAVVKAEPVPVPVPVPVPAPEPEVVIQPQPEIIAQAEPEAAAAPGPEIVLEPEPELVPEPELAHEISAQELHTLLGEFTRHYQAMDAAGFAALFTPDAHTSESDGRRKIQRMYAAFFEENTIHGFSFKNVAWHAQRGTSRRGSALAIIASAPAAGGRSSVVQATISFQVERSANNAVLISRMTY